MADDDMLDTQYLFQPRGPGTAWLFRMPTPAALIGRINPRTGALVAVDTFPRQPAAVAGIPKTKAVPRQDTAEVMLA